ncbi:hypothetical protein HYALB_00010981 [Hymenoscyphus albidus]|uniref:Uncharacterized protein n=1 Tax=Hymenoscyphus albidus TaxID=595503 RepID=A0A9N9Q300_9HELO|nr:hypothetical protein HYALB_00010981 [Hymenoscyphus albidus]
MNTSSYQKLNKLSCKDFQKQEHKQEEEQQTKTQALKKGTDPLPYIPQAKSADDRSLSNNNKDKDETMKAGSILWHMLCKTVGYISHQSIQMGSYDDGHFLICGPVVSCKKKSWTEGAIYGNQDPGSEEFTHTLKKRTMLLAAVPISLL